MVSESASKAAASDLGQRERWEDSRLSSLSDWGGKGRFGSESPTENLARAEQALELGGGGALHLWARLQSRGPRRVQRRGNTADRVKQGLGLASIAG